MHSLYGFLLSILIARFVFSSVTREIFKSKIKIENSFGFEITYNCHLTFRIVHDGWFKGKEKKKKEQIAQSLLSLFFFLKKVNPFLPANDETQVNRFISSTKRYPNFVPPSPPRLLKLDCHSAVSIVTIRPRYLSIIFSFHASFVESTTGSTITIRDPSFPFPASRFPRSQKPIPRGETRGGNLHDSLKRHVRDLIRKNSQR